LGTPKIAFRIIEGNMSLITAAPKKGVPEVDISGKRMLICQPLVERLGRGTSGQPHATGRNVKFGKLFDFGKNRQVYILFWKDMDHTVGSLVNLAH
jgi:hypothetical protein